MTEQIPVPMDLVIEAIKQQRNSALDSVALYSARCMDLERRLEEATKQLEEKHEANTASPVAPAA
jgi:hypothetical protein